jgi:hypothetical protein
MIPLPPCAGVQPPVGAIRWGRPRCRLCVDSQPAAAAATIRGKRTVSALTTQEGGRLRLCEVLEEAMCWNAKVGAITMRLQLPSRPSICRTYINLESKVEMIRHSSLLFHLVSALAAQVGGD